MRFEVSDSSASSVSQTHIFIKPNSATHAVMSKHKFINATVLSKNESGGLNLKDNFVPGLRGWKQALEQASHAVLFEQALTNSETPISIDDDFESGFKDEWKNVLMLPIVTYAGSFVITAAGKTSANCFSFADEELFLMCGQQCFNLVTQHELRNELDRMMEVVHLDLSKANLQDLTDNLVHLSNAERGAIYILHELHDNVTGETQKFLKFNLELQESEKKERKDIFMPLDKNSIVGCSFLENKIINIDDCYQDERFHRNVDPKSGFTSKQMLCVPMLSTFTGDPIAVMQVINKVAKNQLPDADIGFVDRDVQILKALNAYVELSIDHKTEINENEARRADSIGYVVVAGESEGVIIQGRPFLGNEPLTLERHASRFRKSD